MDSYWIMNGIKVVVALSLLPIAAIACVSFLWSLIQSTTQIQEQTIGHLLRLGIFGLLLYFFGDVSANTLIDFTQESFLQGAKSSSTGKMKTAWYLNKKE